MTSLNRIGIVLSGGGTKLFTHIGWLEALDDAGLLNQQVSAVVGTSAGAIAGALYALGYTPREAWKLTYWRAWGYDPPDDDGRHWRSDTRPRLLNHFIDLDFENMEQALTRNISHFKGLDSGRKIEAALRRHLDWRDQEPDSEFLGSLPPEGRKPLYLVALNISNRRQAVFHFEAHCRPPEPALRAAEWPSPAPGREVYYEYYHDIEHLDKPTEEQLQVWEAVRCSTALPTVFQPYLKRNLTVELLDGDGQRVTQTAYYTDGGARDNYSLSTAVKFADCDAVFGQYLGQPSYPFQVVGHGTLVDVVHRNIDAMRQAIYEADQDDGEIYAHPVRTLIPDVRVRPDVTFDIHNIGDLKEAGYIAAAYYLWRCSPGTDQRMFFESLLDGQITLNWETVFQRGGETWGEAGRGRQAVAPPDSHYYVIRPQPAFVEMAQQVFEARYPGPATGKALRSGRDSGLGEELARRNQERREIAPAELNQPIFHGPLQQAQAVIVKWGRRLAWFSVTGIVAYVLTALWVSWALLTSAWAAMPGPSLSTFIGGEITILLLTLVAGWFGHRWAARWIWQRVQNLIAARIGTK